MAALGDAFSPLTNAISQAKAGTTAVATSSGAGSGLIIFIAIFVGLAVFGVIGAFIWVHFSEKRKWNIQTRVHYENPDINGVSFGNPVLTKRIRFKDGIVAYRYKTPVQGYTISPELLTWTRPREHDIIVTQDKKVFAVNGMDSIDLKRKKLGVDISYPDIEMDRQDLQKHIDSKKYDDPNERFKIIAKISLWVFLIIGIIVVSVIWGKSYVDGKKSDAAKAEVELKAAESQAKTMEEVNTFVLILSKVMPKSFQAIDGQNLLVNVTGVGA